MKILVNESERALLEFLFKLKNRHQIQEGDYQRFLNWCKKPNGVYHLVSMIIKSVNNKQGQKSYLINPLPIPHYFSNYMKSQFLNLVRACLTSYKNEIENQRFLKFYKKKNIEYLENLKKSIEVDIKKEGMHYLLTQSDLSHLDMIDLSKFKRLKIYPNIYSAIVKYQIMSRALELLDLKPKDAVSEKSNRSFQDSKLFQKIFPSFQKQSSTYSALYRYRYYLKKNENLLNNRRDNSLQIFLKILGLGVISIVTVGIGTYSAYHAFFGNNATRAVRLAHEATGKSNRMAL